MNEHTVEYSLLLSMLGIGVAMLAAQVTLAWVRQAQHGVHLQRRWRELLLAAFALGTGLSAASVLTLGAEALVFSIGYHALGAVALWLLALVGAVPAVALLAWGRDTAVLFCSGLLMALLVIGLQVGWVSASGLQPGIVWKSEIVALAAVVLVAGLSSAVWLSQASAEHEGPRRLLMRGGAAVLAGLIVVAGQEVLISATNLAMQKRSEHAYDLNSALLSMVAGVLVPLGLAMMALDVDLRSRSRHRREIRNDFTPVPKRRRRPRVRSL